MAQEDTDNPESTPETPETEAAAEGGRESAVKASARALDAAITASEDLRAKLIR